MIIFGKPFLSDLEKNEVMDSLNSGWLSTGPKVTKFKEQFRKYIGSKYAIPLNSCSAALFLSLKIFNISEGDEVITSPMTYAATVNVIEHTCAKPTFVDVDKNTGIINTDKIEETITRKTKAIIPIHYCGYPCDLDKINKIAKKYKLHVIEDAAHCIEGFYKNKKIGTLSDTTCFSFYATKNITSGEGGMLTTDNKRVAEAAQIYSSQGMSLNAWNRHSNKKYQNTYQVVLPGYKFNMMDLQAAIGIQQLKKIDKFYKLRQIQWITYINELKNTDLILPIFPPEKGSKHALHLFTILIDKKRVGLSRDDLQKKLRKKGIGTGIHFISIHNHKYYKEKYKFKKNDFPNANYISTNTLSLPIGPALTKKEQEYIIKSIKLIINA